MLVSCVKETLLRLLKLEKMKVCNAVGVPSFAVNVWDTVVELVRVPVNATLKDPVPPASKGARSTELSVNATLFKCRGGEGEILEKRGIGRGSTRQVWA
jgi:hypothetical protein